MGPAKLPELQEEKQALIEDQQRSGVETSREGGDCNTGGVNQEIGGGGRRKGNLVPGRVMGLAGGGGFGANPKHTTPPNHLAPTKKGGHGWRASQMEWVAGGLSASLLPNATRRSHSMALGGWQKDVSLGGVDTSSAVRYRPLMGLRADWSVLKGHRLVH